MQTSGHPCPACGAAAAPTVGCRRCGRSLDPTAAEVLRLDAEIRALTTRMEQTWRTYLDLAAAWRAAHQRRAELTARAYANTAAAPGPVPPPGRQETSARTVQGFLFVLGGLLLGTAAVVFTAVAWAAVGVTGRAVILVGVTGLALAVPPLAARRGLRGTAETIAAVALVLVLLDGYAAWTVDLGGVSNGPGTRYAAVVGAVTVAVAAGYGLLTRLAAPWFAALVIAQPALPLLAVDASPGVAGWALVFTGVALLDVAVLAVLRRWAAPSQPLITAGRIAAGVGYGIALVPAASCAAVSLLGGEAYGSVFLAGLPLLLVAVTLLGAALALGGVVAPGAAAALLVVGTAAAMLRPLAELRPSLLLLSAAVVTVGLAGTARLLPPVRSAGIRAGALVVAVALGQLTVVLTAVVTVAAVARSASPPWQGGSSALDLRWGWQLPVAVVLVTAALRALLPGPARIPVGLGGVVLAVLAMPAAGPVPWSVLVGLDVVVGTALLLAAAFRPGGPAYRPVLLAGAGAVLTGHALLVQVAVLPTRAGTLVGLGMVLVVAVVVGVAGRSAAVRPFGWVVAAVASAAVAVTAALAGGLPLRSAAFTVLAAAVCVLTGAALVARRRPTEGLVLDAAAQGVALVAFLISVGALRHTAALCVVWGVAVGLRALRAGETAGRRWTFAGIAGGSELLGGWLLPVAGQVTLPEAYTLPAAGLVLVAGYVALRTRPGLTSWVALGPALTAALVPSLVSVVAVPGDAQPWRRLLLGTGALAVVLVGAVRRWQAPVVLGGASLALLAAQEVLRSWDLLPRWAFLALGGLVLIGLATTYERRRRDLARLRTVVGRMG